MSNEKSSLTSNASEQYLTEQFDIKPAFERFNPRNDIFNRAIWDEKINPRKFFASYDIANYAPKKSKGFDHWDYALRNASWHLTDHVGERHFKDTGEVEGFTHPFTTQIPGPEVPVSLMSPEETTKRIKRAAKLFGAGMVGITHVDKRWVYSHSFKRNDQTNESFDLPSSMQWVIMLIMPMDYELGTTFPSALSGSTTGKGYADSLQCATMLAQFITNLGYEAMASLNDTALNIPMSIQAGLGEYGRHGLLISRDYGPNVRIAKVFTNLPLIGDSPKPFGVKPFCEICRKCSDACPPRAIAADAPQAEPPNFSSHSHIKKWTVNAEKCFKFWVGMNTDCAICIRVCPYNKDYTKWWNRLGIRLAGGPLRKFMLWLDKVLKFGKRVAPESWWKK